MYPHRSWLRFYRLLRLIKEFSLRSYHQRIGKEKVVLLHTLLIYAYVEAPFSRCTARHPLLPYKANREQGWAPIKLLNQEPFSRAILLPEMTNGRRSAFNPCSRDEVKSAMPVSWCMIGLQLIDLAGLHITHIEKRWNSHSPWGKRETDIPIALVKVVGRLWNRKLYFYIIK